MIAKSPQDRTKFKRDIHLTNSARQGWEVILRALNPGSRILLPSYIGITDREGSGIYDPVLAVGIKHDFYLLNDDLSISVFELEKWLTSGKYQLILLVHYFGFEIENIKYIVELCRKHNVIVVEDCAHLYNYNQSDYSSAGTYGDCAFYSLHKNFPFESGGMVLQNTSDRLKLNFPQLILSERFSLELLQYDAGKIAAVRRKNFAFLNELLADIPEIIPFKTLQDIDIPHNYPIIVKNGLREKLYFWLIERGMTTIALYYRLIEPLNTEKFSAMHKISNNILNLPIHQDMDFQSIVQIVDYLKAGLRALNK